MRIIGLSGKIGTGKTTLAQHLLGKLPVGWKRRGFGDLLKEETALLFGFPLEWAYEHKDWIWKLPEGSTRFVVPEPHDPYGMTVREILQWYGTDVRRAQDPDYWVNAMQEWLDIEARTGTPGVIIDDCRFPNEIEVADYRVRIDPYTMWRCQPCIAAHESETALDSYGGWHLAVKPAYGELSEMAELVVGQMGVKQCG